MHSHEEASLLNRSCLIGLPSLTLSAISANPWLSKLGEVIDALAALANGRFPVAVPLLRGPWDLVCALRGQENAYFDVYGRS